MSLKNNYTEKAYKLGKEYGTIKGFAYGLFIGCTVVLLLTEFA